MGEELLALLRGAAQELATGPVAEQAAQDVRELESIAAKHAEAYAAEAKQWLINRLHPVLGTPAA